MGAINLYPKDGDGGDDFTSIGIMIEPASNGWVVYWSDDEEDVKEVYVNKKELIKRLDELL